MDRQDEYRRYANEAIELADRSKNPSDKASWLQIARKWLDMLPKREATAQEQFDEHAAARGTGQERSHESH
jgi:hypothetical protein